MDESHDTDLEPLTGGSTTYFSRIVPVVLTSCGVLAVLAAWFDLLGAGPVPEPAKLMILAVAGGMTLVSFRFLWRLPHVWRNGDELIVGDPVRGFRIPLSQVQEVKESRFQHIKTVTIELGRPLPTGGHSITFVPKGAATFFLPLAGSSVAEELRERTRRLNRSLKK